MIDHGCCKGVGFILRSAGGKQGYFDLPVQLDAYFMSFIIWCVKPRVISSMLGLSISHHEGLLR